MEKRGLIEREEEEEAEEEPMPTLEEQLKAMQGLQTPPSGHIWRECSSVNGGPA